MQAGIVANLNRRVARIRADTAYDHALADQQRKTKGEIVTERTSEATTLAGLRVALNPSGRSNRRPLAVFQVRQRSLLRFYYSDA
jgi:hypothetical protein